MIPILFEIGPIAVYSFGLMLGIAFLVANYFFAREIRRHGLPEQVAGAVTLIALVGGVVGSKLFSLVENWNRFVADPIGEAFSSAGLTFYGGLIVATLSILLYLRYKRIRFLTVADSAAPSLILAYGIGRIGCQLAGDGDYGVPSDLPWAMGYPEGTVPTLAASNSDLKAKFMEMYPGRAVPEDIMVHPAPVYETLAAVAIFLLLWRWRTKEAPDGRLFAVYLMLAGLERLLVEFIRLNPLYLGLSQAQWISVGMIVVGSMMLYALRNSPPATIPPATAKTRMSAGKRK